MTVQSKIAAREAASNMCTSLHDGQDIESAHIERQDHLHRILEMLMVELSDDSLEVLRQQLSDKVCYMCWQAADWKLQKLEDQARRLDRMSHSRYAGSDTHDEQMQRGIEFAQQLEYDRETWLDLLAAAEKVYERENHRPWMPPAGRGADNRAKTATMAEASTFISRYRGNQPQN